MYGKFTPYGRACPHCGKTMKKKGWGLWYCVPCVITLTYDTMAKTWHEENRFPWYKIATSYICSESGRCKKDCVLKRAHIMDEDASKFECHIKGGIPGARCRAFY